MKSFVITLEKNKDRQCFCNKDIAFPFEFFNAVNGIDEEVRLRDSYEIKNYFHQATNKRLSAAQLGCFASHYNLWIKCIELDQPIIIMEDDGLMSNIIPQDTHIELIENLLSIHDFICLEPKLDKRSIINQSRFNDYYYELYLLSNNSISTLAYAITPKAAKKLVDRAKVWEVPVDNFIGNHHWHGVYSFQLYPYLKLRERNFKSDTKSNRVHFKFHIKFLNKINRIKRNSQRYLSYKKFKKTT